MGNEDEQLREVTMKTATGKLAEFLKGVEKSNSEHTQLDKFTEMGEDGARQFIRGDATRLQDVPAGIEDQIRHAFAADQYGVTLSRTGALAPPALRAATPPARQASLGARVIGTPWVRRLAHQGVG